jgi:hypothetical protein
MRKVLPFSIGGWQFPKMKSAVMNPAASVEHVSTMRPSNVSDEGTAATNGLMT